VGFYNSNEVAGASQEHRHLQLLPMDGLWAMRNTDAPYALPIDDVILPRIESGAWLPVPYSSSSVGKSSKGSWYKSSTDKGSSAGLYSLPQFEFQHSVAPLLDRSVFRSNAEFGEYLSRVYLSLLSAHAISHSLLSRCAERRGATAEAGTAAEAGTYAVGVDVCAGAATAYNLLLTSRYMLIVPRTRAEYTGADADTYAVNIRTDTDRDRGTGTNTGRDTDDRIGAGSGTGTGAPTSPSAVSISVNSYGFLGMLLAKDDAALRAIEGIGPIAILQAVTRPIP